MMLDFRLKQKATESNSAMTNVQPKSKPNAPSLKPTVY